MKRGLRPPRWAFLALVLVLTAAVGASEILSGPPNSLHPRRPPRIDASVASSYGSISQLEAASTSTVLLRATASTTSSTVGRVPWTTTAMTVVQVEAGPSLPGTILLRQLGPGVGAPVVDAGQLYLAYIQPFQWTPGGPDVANDYVVIGGLQGLYQEAASYAGAMPDASAQAFDRVDALASALPATLSLDQATTSSATPTTAETTTTQSPTTGSTGTTTGSTGTTTSSGSAPAP
jgi:hypothetical protein